MVDCINIKREIGKGIKNALKNLINENVTLITEKWSISDKVDEYYDIVINDITKDIINSDVEKIDDGILFYTNKIENYNLLGEYVTLEYFIYNCSSTSICKFIYEKADKVNGYDEKEKVLNITLYQVNGIWFDEYCERNLVHELEHILQIHYGFTKNANYKQLVNSAYEFANYVIANQQNYSRIEIIIAKLVYYSNSHEQDAFIQEYARELKHNFSLKITHKAEIHKILEQYTNYCIYFLNNKDAPNVRNVIKQYKLFGYNSSNFEKMATKQLNRLKRKINNVEKNFR